MPRKRSTERNPKSGPVGNQPADTVASIPVLVDLDDVRSYPLQAEYFRACSAADDAALQAQVERGDVEPIHLLPGDNAAGLPALTILDGHRRIEAHRRAGKRKILAIVHNELKDADGDEVDRVFLSYNFTRRQLDVIDKARVAYKLFKLEKVRETGRLDGNFESDARDRVGKMIGQSGRNLQRYFSLLQAPNVVQDAVRDGRLKLTLGCRLVMLTPAVQQEIADKLIEMGEGKNANSLVAAYFAGAIAHQKIHVVFKRVIHRLQTSLRDLDGRVDEIGGHRAQLERATLESTLKILRQLLQAADAESA